MIVVGGTYVERCTFPHWNHIFGSGLRAAVALSSLSSKCVLHSYVNELWADDVKATLETFGVASSLLHTTERIAFDYLYGGFDRLSSINPETIKKSEAIEAEGDAVLCFGMLEGSARVKGKRVVFDPQYADAGTFWDNGSKAEQLALILNSGELIEYGNNAWPGDKDPRLATDDERNTAARNIFDTKLSPHVVLIVKHAVGGADVYTNDESPVHVPAYAVNSFFKLGSGDIFSAAFAYAWGALQMHTVEAAKYASLCAAYYVEDRQLALPAPTNIELKPEIGRRGTGRISLTGSITEANAQLLKHARRSIQSFGGISDLQLMEIRDRLFDVGLGDVVLGLFDLDAKVNDVVRLRSLIGDRTLILFWPSLERTLSPMPNTIVTADYATALYLALREAKR